MLSTPNSRKVRKKKRKTDDTFVCMFDNFTKHQLTFHKHFFFWSPIGNFHQIFSCLLFFSPWQPKWLQQLVRCYVIYRAHYLVSDRPKAWLLRVIIWSLRALCCLPSLKKQNFHLFFVQNIIKQLLDLVFVISRILKVSASVVSLISLSLQLWLITPACTSTLIILDVTKPHPLIV